jgi:hypothetical protein
MTGPDPSRTRWHLLFDDLEAQFEAAQSAELDEEVADRTRREAARLEFADRLRPTVGSPVSVAVLGAGTVRGRLADVGPDWALIVEPPSRDVLVRLGAVLGVDGLSARSAAPASAGVVVGRLNLGHALRGLARSRVVATFVLVDGTAVVGRIDRVGADFVELTATGSTGRPEAAVRVVPHGALALVRAP